jgi:hypothetical protein
MGGEVPVEVDAVPLGKPEGLAFRLETHELVAPLLLHDHRLARLSRLLVGENFVLGLDENPSVRRLPDLLVLKRVDDDVRRPAAGHGVLRNPGRTGADDDPAQENEHEKEAGRRPSCGRI